MFERLSPILAGLERARVLAVLGNGIFDSYLVDAQHQVEFKHALLLVLQEAGFSGVGFSSPHQTRYFLDPHSEVCFPIQIRAADSNLSTPTITGPLGAVNLLAPRAENHLPINDSSLLLGLDRAMKTATPAKALVIEAPLTYFSLFKNQRLLNGILADWLALPPENPNRLILVFPNLSQDDFLATLNRLPVPVIASFLAARDKDSRLINAVTIGAPGHEEMYRLFERNQGKIAAGDAEKLLRLSSSQTTSLSDWITRFSRLERIDLETAGRLGWFDSRINPKRSALDQLGELTGLANIKAKIQQLGHLQQMTRTLGIGESPTMHLLFSGHPGTGKTTVARLIGEIYHDLGLLGRGHLVQVSASDLVGNHVGETAIKTQAIIDRALDGVLFIDEAYSLTEKDRGGFGMEAVETLLVRMENDRNRLMVILAGYPEKMRAFLRANPGLERRIPEANRLEFPNYSARELAEIFERGVREKGFECHPDLSARLVQVFAQMAADNRPTYGNAGEVRNLVESLVLSFASRHAGKPPARMVLELADLPPRWNNLVVERAQLLRLALDELDHLVGLESVKEFVRQLAARIQLDSLLAQTHSNRPLRRGLNFIFYGNPGTGKTTVARLMGKILFATGVLPSDRVTEVTRRDLVAEYVGQTAEKTHTAILSALDGVLFIDEAYTLHPRSPGDFASEALAELIKGIDAYSQRLVVILAGYPEEMSAMVDANPGLASRFSNVLNFPNYSMQNLYRILAGLAERDGIRIPTPAREAIFRYLFQLQRYQRSRFGNARSAENLYEQIINRLAVRLQPLMENSALDPSHLSLIVEDIPPLSEPVEAHGATSGATAELSFKMDEAENLFGRR